MPRSRRLESEAGRARSDPEYHRAKWLFLIATLRGSWPDHRRGCDPLRRRVRRVWIRVDRSRPTWARGLPRSRSRLHPIHLGDHGHQQGRRLVSSRDARAREGRRRRARLRTGRPHRLGPSARLSLRRDHRRLRPGRRPRAALLGHAPRKHRRRDRAPSRDRALRVTGARRADRRSRPGGQAPQPAARAVDERADPEPRDRALRGGVRTPARPGLRDHRGGAALHQPGNAGSRRDIGRAGRCRATR